jgi:hypothetical protein
MAEKPLLLGHTLEHKSFDNLIEKKSNMENTELKNESFDKRRAFVGTCWLDPYTWLILDEVDPDKNSLHATWKPKVLSMAAANNFQITKASSWLNPISEIVAVDVLWQGNPDLFTEVEVSSANYSDSAEFEAVFTKTTFAEMDVRYTAQGDIYKKVALSVDAGISNLGIEDGKPHNTQYRTYKWRRKENEFAIRFYFYPVGKTIAEELLTLEAIDSNLELMETDEIPFPPTN